MTEITPTIHLNGTGREGLLEQTSRARHAVREAIRAIHEAWPHGRDYYPQGDGALRAAEKQFATWAAHLAAVEDGLEQLAMRICEAGR